MGRAIGIKLGKLVEVNHGNRKKRFTNGDNRRERKLKKEIKQLRQVVHLFFIKCREPSHGSPTDAMA